MAECPKCNSESFYFVDAWINYHNISILEPHLELSSVDDSISDDTFTEHLYCEDCGACFYMDLNPYAGRIPHYYVVTRKYATRSVQRICFSEEGAKRVRKDLIKQNQGCPNQYIIEAFDAGGEYIDMQIEI